MYQATLPFVAVRQNASVDELLEKMVQKLEEAHGKNIAVEDGTVRFRGGAFRGMFSRANRWDFLVPITRGEIYIDRDAMSIQYHLTFTKMFISAPIMFGVMATLALALDVPKAVVIAMFIGIVLVGIAVNIPLSIFRFKRFLKSCLQEAGFNDQ